MSFCTKCGRPHAEDVRFCTGCGTQFPAQTPTAQTPLTAVPLTPTPPPGEATRLEPIPTAAEPVESGEPAEQTRRDGPLDAARWAPPVNATRVEPSATDLVPAAAFLPPSAPVAPRRRFGGGTRMAFIIAGVLIVLAAGGGAYALVARSSGHATAQPPSHPSVTAGASTASPTAQATTSPTASPTTSPSASATPSPSPTQTGTVRVVAAVASSPEEPQVDAYLNRYFSSINTHNYNEYNSLLDAQEQQADSQSSFNSGFATTKDSNEMLTGIQDTGGNVTATVSFTSRQNTADSVDGSACNNWQISLILAPQGNSYVMTAAPAGYHAAYTDC
jgi:hypothetical protein